MGGQNAGGESGKMRRMVSVSWRMMIRRRQIRTNGRAMRRIRMPRRKLKLLVMNEDMIIVVFI